MTTNGNTRLEYFDRMYQVPDPWGYETSWYEQRKYALTLAALPRPTYHRAFEPGCSIGVLTEMLAPRVDELVAADFHPATLDRARARLAQRPGVQVVAMEVPFRWPDGRFDLVVISEVAYYLEDQSLDALVDRSAESLLPDGDLVLVHWRGETDYPQTADDVHRRWTDDSRFTVSAAHHEDAFRLDVLRRCPDRAGRRR